LGPRLLAVDLDGTLLDPAGRPHTDDVNAIRAALAAGVHVSIVTGRLYSGTRATVEILGLDGAVGLRRRLPSRAGRPIMRRCSTWGVWGRGEPPALGFSPVPGSRPSSSRRRHRARPAPALRSWTTSPPGRATCAFAESVFEHVLWDADDGVTGVVAVGTEGEVSSVVAELARELPGR